MMRPSINSLSLHTAVFLARPGHWLKNIYMLPGIALAAKLSEARLPPLLVPGILGLSSVCLIASANYVINEWLDAPSDRFHPTKQLRPLVVGRFSPSLIYLEFVILALAGLGLAAAVSSSYFFWSACLLGMGILYNVRPMRLKDIAYVDVISEGLDNPIRMIMGWVLVIPASLPPWSALAAYWMASGYQVTLKRLGEIRFIADAGAAHAYRRSFRKYTETRLLQLALFSSSAAAVFFGIFLVKYRVEYLLMLPFFALLFGWYLAISLKKNSASQDVAQLYDEERPFLVFVGVCVLAFAVLTLIDLDWLRRILL